MTDAKMPRHVAIIMDGNGRWAKKRGLPRLKGHAAGADSLVETVKHAKELGIEYLTVYAFSTENWKRPADEVTGLFRLLENFVRSRIEEIAENDIRINIIGDWKKLPDYALQALEYAVDRTKENDDITLNIALNYGGRAEIVKAVREIAAEASEGCIIDEQTVAEHLYTTGIPDPDLLIRTSGELRISNFLIWQIAYSEIVVTDTYWPDFDAAEFDRCLDEYMHRDRRFGGLK